MSLCRTICPVLLVLLVFISSCTPPMQEIQKNQKNQENLVNLENAVQPSEPVAPDTVFSDLTDDPKFNELCRFLDGYLKNHNDDYRDAVKLICFELAKLCEESDAEEKKLGKPEPLYPKGGEPSGTLSFCNPKNSMGHSTYATGFQLKDGNVVGLDFEAVEEIDSCPCTSTFYPAFLDNEFLDVIVKINTLEDLRLPNAKISDTGLKKLACLTELKSLIINDRYYYQQPPQSQLDFSGFQALHGLTKLERLIVKQGENSSDQVQSEHLFEALTYYPNLRELQVDSITLNQKNAERLATCQQLGVLYLEKSQMTEPCLDRLETLKGLGTLKLDFDPKGHAVSFAGHPNLQDFHLTLSENPESPTLEQDIKISELENVSWLTIHTHNILQPQLELADLANLGHLYVVIHPPDRMDDLAPSISLQNMPALTSFVYNCPISNLSLALDETENIKELSLGYNYSFHRNVGNRDDRETNMLENVPTSPIPAALMDEILKLENLERLALQGPFDEIDLTQLNRLKNLTQLELTGKPSVSPEFRLAGLENIQRINLSYVVGTEKLVFENLSKLKRIQTSDSYTDEIAVSDCSQLNDFYYGGGRFGNLIFERCPALTQFRVDLYSPHSKGLVDLRGTSVKEIQWGASLNWLPQVLMPE